MTSPVWLESTYYTTIVNHSPNGWGALAGTSSPKEQTHLPPNLGVEIKYGPPHGHSDQIIAPSYGISSDSKQTCGRVALNDLHVALPCGRPSLTPHR